MQVISDITLNFLIFSVLETVWNDNNVLMTNEMHNSYNQFYSTVFLSALRVSNESSRSSSGAHKIYCITQSGTIGTIVQATRLHDCTDCTV